MDAELKRKWCERLRSGEILQARGLMLDTENGAMCCLGVLREIVEPGSLRIDKDGRQFLPEDIAIKAGLDDAVSMESQQRKLANMNDGRMGHDRHSFKEIADYIEANL